jgi:hypothetical protein
LQVLQQTCHYYGIKPSARITLAINPPNHLCFPSIPDAPEVEVGFGTILVDVPPKMSSVVEPEVVTTTGVPEIITVCPILAVILPPMMTSGFPEIVVGTAFSVATGAATVDIAGVDEPDPEFAVPTMLVEGDELPDPGNTISVIDPDVITCPTCPPIVTL